MIIYEKQPRYSQQTGEQDGYMIVEKERRCDFSGELIGNGGWESRPYTTYTLDYGNSDACYGCDGAEKELRFEHHIEVGLLMDSPFEIRYDYEDADVKTDFTNSEAPTFAWFLRECKAKTVLRLIQEGTIEPFQLEGGPDPE